MTITLTPLDIIEQALERAGKQVRRRGETLVAQCPAHDDGTPSLSVTPGSKGRDIVLHCHAGCTADAVMGALGVRWTDLADQRTPSNEVAIYTYTDERSRPLYRVHRMVGKKFLQAHITSTGEWEWGLNGTRSVLYALPAVEAAMIRGDPVYLVEGEKDADRLLAKGLAATCNNGGAGKQTDTQADQLAGATVIVVADRDKAGYNHARRWRELLEPRHCRVEVFEARLGKDVSDHLDAGYTLDQLVPVDLDDGPADEGLEDAEAVDPESDDGLLLGMLVDWPALWAREHADAEWIAEPLIADKRGTCLFAPGGTGKSLLALWLAAKVATGGIGLDGQVVQRRRVLYLDYEMTGDDLLERLAAMGYGADSDLTWLHYALLPGLPPADAPEGGKAIARMAELVGAGLVVIDTFSRAVEGDENDADTVRNFYRWTGLHLKAAGRAYVRVDHAGKDLAKGQRGSSAKNDDVDVVWQMVKADAGFTLTTKKRRMSWVPETVAVLQYDEPNLHYRTVAELAPAGTDRVIADLDELSVPPSIGYRKAANALRDAGRGARNELVRAAQKARLGRTFGHQKVSPDGRGAPPAKQAGLTPGLTTPEMGADQGGAHFGAHPGAPVCADGAHRRSIERAHPAPSPERDVEDDLGMF